MVPLFPRSVGLLPVASASPSAEPTELHEIFSVLGSNLNPVLTQLAKTRRVVFVEGKDFQIISKFANRLDANDIASRSAFAVVPIGGFAPDRIRSLKDGMETTLGGKISAAAILDRDYRSSEECGQITRQCEAFCDWVAIHSRKEIENFLLVPEAIDRAVSRRVEERRRRGAAGVPESFSATRFLRDYVKSQRSYVTSQYLARRRQFERSRGSTVDEATGNEAVLDELASKWDDFEVSMRLVPGKDALRELNIQAQAKCSVSITPTSIISAMRESEIPSEMRQLIVELTTFAATVHHSQE